MSSKDDRIKDLQLEVSFLLEDLEEVENENEKKQARIVELLDEVDRLTGAYEPYRPEGDEDEGLTFYGLKEENEELNSQIHHLKRDLSCLSDTYYKTLYPPVRKTIRDRLFKEPRYAGQISFSFWPLRDLFRFSVSGWMPGHYFQLVIGPVTVEFFAT